MWEVLAKIGLYLMMFYVIGFCLMVIGAGLYVWYMIKRGREEDIYKIKVKKRARYFSYDDKNNDFVELIKKSDAPRVGMTTKSFDSVCQ